MSADHSTEQGTRDLTQLATLVFAAAFILVGLAGFVPGITQHYNGSSGMHFSGPHSHALLLHVFRVSILHNAVHLAYGLVGLLCTFTVGSARLYLIAGGVVYLALWIYGLVIDQTSSANFVPVNTADNWLHLVLGVAMVALGVVLHRRAVRAS